MKIEIWFKSIKSWFNFDVSMDPSVHCIGEINSSYCQSGPKCWFKIKMKIKLKLHENYMKINIRCEKIYKLNHLLKIYST